MGQLQPASNPSQNLANGIATAEGYNVPGSIPDVANNPGDLKLGDIGYGVQSNGVTNFPNADAGFTALNNQVQLIQSGNSKAGYTTDMSINQVAQLYTGGDNPTGWAATVAKTAGVDPNSNFSQTAQGVVNPTQSTPIGQTDPTTTLPATALASVDEANLNATDYVPITGQDISSTDLDALTPNYVLADNNGLPQGLDGPAWFEDDQLFTGHEHLDAAIPAPITFEIMLPGANAASDSNNYMTDSQGNKVVIELNVSARSLNVQEKHIFHRTPSRTGMHLTFWGMQPDLITGQCSTGGFYNQFGLSSFMSTADFSGTLRSQILAIFQNSQQASLPITGTTASTPAPDQDDLDQAQGGFTSESLRVAAQDAFQEMLELFKNNGVVYYHPTGNSGTLTGTQQVSPTAWSPQQGVSSFEMNALNNDVMARGHVVMKFKNNMYQGYFKSFNWTQDAEKPFQWDFGFVFQVERTISVVSFPFATSSPVSSAAGVTMAPVTTEGTVDGLGSF